MNDTPNYHAAIIINPCRQIGWFEMCWAEYPEGIQSVRDGMEALFEVLVKDLDSGNDTLQLRKCNNQSDTN